MYKIAAIGDRDSVSGFKSIGLETYFVSGEKETAETLKKLVETEEYAAIYITEESAALVADGIDSYKERVTPAIILIPGVKGNTGEGMNISA